jgi:hypothetical protein
MPLLGYKPIWHLVWPKSRHECLKSCTQQALTACGSSEVFNDADGKGIRTRTNRRVGPR